MNVLKDIRTKHFKNNSRLPLLDPKLIDKLIKIYKKNNFDYVSNIEKRTFPDGMDIEIFNFKSLHNANLNLNTELLKNMLLNIF